MCCLYTDFWICHTLVDIKTNKVNCFCDDNFFEIIYYLFLYYFFFFIGYSRSNELNSCVAGVFTNIQDTCVLAQTQNKHS